MNQQIIDTFTKNDFKIYFNKKILNSKTKDELIDLYCDEFKIKPDAKKKLLSKIKTKEDIITLILKKIDAQYLKSVTKTYNAHKDEYSSICNSFTTGILNDESKTVKDRIHAIHDFIRNKGFGYGMTGLKLFNLFYGLLQIEKSGILDNWTFSEQTLKNTGMSSNEELINFISFSKIYQMAKSYNDLISSGSDLEINLSSLIKNLCEKFRHFSRGPDSKLKSLVYYDLSHMVVNAIDIKNLIILIKELDELTDSENIQLAGKIYEYFVGRDQSAISELGAYFTDRHLVNYIFKEMLDIENTIDIENMPYVCDMFGGSGGFTINFIVYVNKIMNSKNLSSDEINNFWQANINNINHYDVNQDVVNNARLEAFCLTKQLITKIYFGIKNSFTDNYFGNDKYDLIISNPPYGGDKVNETSKMKEYNTIINYNKQLLYDNYNDDMTEEERAKLIIQNNFLEQEIKYLKEQQKSKCVNYKSCSLIIKKYCDLIIDHENAYLKSIGKKGNKKSGDGFNDKESCSLVLLMALCAPGGRVLGVLKEGVFFDKKYTHIRRYLLKHFIIRRVDSNPSDAFENTTTKTTNILFELPKKNEKIPDDYDIEFYDVKVVKNTTDEFNRNNNFTYLNSANNGIIKSVEASNKTIVSVKTILANDECSLNSKEYNKVELKPGDGFKLVKLGDICEFLPKSKRLASFSNDNGKYRFYSSGSKILNCDKADYKDKYIIIIGHSGNGCIFIDNEFSTLLTNHLLYNKNYDKLKYIYYHLNSIWNYFYSSCYYGSTVKNTSDKKIEKFNISIPETDEQLKYWVNHLSEPYDKLQKYKTKLVELEEQVQKDIQEILDNNECEEIMLGDLCEFKNGKPLSKKQIINGIYPVIGGGKESYGYHNNYNCKKNTILCSSSGAYAGYISIYKTETWISDCFSIKPNDKKINIYLYYLLKFIYQDKIYSIKQGSVQPHVYSKDLAKLKIQLPIDRKVLDSLNPTFETIDKYNEKIPKYEELYKTRLEELRKAAIKE